MDCQREVGDKFRSRDQEEDRYDSYRRSARVESTSQEAYIMNPSMTQRNPTVQPTVLSPLTLCQSKSRLRENFCPSTIVVKSISTKAAV